MTKTMPSEGAKETAWLVLAAALAVGCDRGCSARGASEDSLFDASLAIAESVLVPRDPSTVPKNVHRSGFVGMMFRASHDVALPAETGSIDAIETSLGGADEAVRAEHAHFQADLAAGIRRGQVDMDRARADLAGIAWAIQSRQDQQAEALTRLHAILAPDQRSTLLAAIRARRAAHALRPPDEAPETAAAWTQRRLDRLTGDLTLDPRQRKAAEALLRNGDLPTPQELEASRQGPAARVDAVLLAFGADVFDAKGPDLGDGDAASRGFAEREAHFLSVLAPILRPDQREKLARSRETSREHREGDEAP